MLASPGVATRRSLLMEMSPISPSPILSSPKAFKPILAEDLFKLTEVSVSFALCISITIRGTPRSKVLMNLSIMWYAGPCECPQYGLRTPRRFITGEAEVVILPAILMVHPTPIS